MANVNLPAKFKSIIETDQRLDGIVKSTVSEFGEILEQNKLYFFSEYTDHGIKHIQDVLLSSDNLITDETYNILGYKDIGYYILSVILHDIGMHIDLQGFICLLDGEFDSVRIESLDAETWKNLWEDYISEARKFSGKQLKSIFGDEDTIIRIPPFSKPGEITENDKKLIGEFIRRHHPRLAHEIAIKGFPGKPNYIEFATVLDERSRNIIGLIARSHGTNLRTCLDNIEFTYGRESRRFPSGIHATFLMVLLRIADYIQIDSSRTSGATIKNRIFSSPISAIEHDAHLAIEDVNYKWHDDPERIFVTALPKNSQMFLKLKKLFKDIQYELDISWAVLGELYGTSTQNKPQIKYRRINSNLENKSFSNQQEYVADNFMFKTNDEIIKLLVAPLYGNNIKYGIRELLQNAIDATKEREYLELEKGNFNYRSKIIVNIYKQDNGETYFSIIDNGLGMDSNIIKNFFLSAGASYRKSLEWQKEFLDENGRAIIRRSGRFGVGILSAFLIGKEIQVETKKINQTRGYRFTASLNTEQINILRDKNVVEGTKITIKIDDSKIADLLDKSNNTFYDEYSNIHYGILWYQWFALANPEIDYCLFGKKLIPYEILSPDINSKLPLDWNSLVSAGYERILWSYSPSYSNTHFLCNGIIIPGAHLENDGLIRNYPQISVFDNDGILPLTLDRNSISEPVQFDLDLINDIYKDFIAYVLMFNENSYVENENIIVKSTNLGYPAFRDYYTRALNSYGINRYREFRTLSSYLNQILISKQGFILNYNFFINKLKTIPIVLIQFNDVVVKSLKLDIKNHFVLINDDRLSSIFDYETAIEPKTWKEETRDWSPFDSRVFLKSEKYQYLFKSKKRLSAWLKNKCKLESNSNNFTILALDNPGPSIISKSFLDNNDEILHFLREYTIECDFEGDKILNELLKKYIGDDVVIPYDIEERKKKYPLAFKELSRYMEKYIKT